MSGSTCLVCGESLAARTCPTCGVDTLGSHYRAIRDADAAIAQYDRQWQQLYAAREQWVDYRARAVDAARAAYAAPVAARAAAPAAVAAAVAAPTVPDSADARAGSGATLATDADGDFFLPMQSQARVQAAPPAAARLASSRGVPEAPSAEMGALKRLTPPALLGIGGAALLIVAAIVYVAVTWETLHPLVQAGTVAGLAAGVGVLGWWLSKRDLVVTAGAVGVVAMAFAGVAVVALDRDFATMGAFGPPAALGVVTAAGMGLAAAGLRWTKAVSAATLVVAATWCAVAAPVELVPVGGEPALTFALAATVMAAVLAVIVSRGLFAGASVRLIRVSAVVLACAAQVAAATPVHGLWPVAIGAVPLAFLVALVWVWPRPAGLAVSGAGALWLGSSAAIVAQAIAGASASLEHPATAKWGWASTGVAVAALVVVVVGARADESRRRWLGWGLAVPATVIIAVAGVLVFALAGALLPPSQVQEPWEPSLGAACAVAVAAAGAMLAQGWRVPSRGREALATHAAVALLIAIPAAMLALTPGRIGAAYPMPMALSALAAGLILVAIALVERLPLATDVVRVGGWVWVCLGGLLAATAIDASPAWALPAVAVALTALAVGAVRYPAITVGPGALLLTVAAGFGAHACGADAHWAWVVAAGIAVAGLGSLQRAPLTWHLPGVAGVVPAVLGAVGIAFLGAGAAVPLILGATDVSWSWSAASAAACALVAVAMLLIRRLVRERWWPTAVEAVGAMAATMAALVPLAVLVGTYVLVPGAGEGARIIAAHAASGLAGLVVLFVAGLLPGGLRDRSRVRVGLRWAVAGWLTVLAASLAARLAWSDVPVAATALALVAIGAAALGAARWWPVLSAVPASLALISVAGALPLALGAETMAAAACAAIALSVATWFAVSASRRGRVGRAVAVAVVAGALPAFAAVVSALTMVLAQLVAQWAALAGGGGVAVTPWQHVVIAAAVAAGALAWPQVRERGLPAVAAWAGLTCAGALPVPVAWIVPLALGVIVVVGAQLRGRRAARTVALVGTALIASAFPWALGSWVAFGVCSAVLGAVLTWQAATSDRRTALAELVAGACFAGLGAGLAVGLGWGASEAGAVAGAAVGLALALAPWLARRDPEVSARFGLVIAATAVPAPWAGSLWGAGIVLLLCAAAWWQLGVVGARSLRWVAGAVGSIGVGLLLASAHVEVIEAYVAVPAVIALTAGARALRARSELSSVAALTPGLAIALTPTVVLLAVAPDHLARALALTAAVAALAVAGVLLRWVAPIGAASITAVALALTQVAASDALVPRWVAFAIVGTTLIVLAATYEKVRQMR
ncbi:SCO7613 C-terminal domain-containing membrane protein [Demequina sp.]|uniref:SCO7613 C-terminal domain-containing membrane protein n=1 Tax=Demequina sp. TaxID=2050685 RepID=UPI003A8C18EB